MTRVRRLLVLMVAGAIWVMGAQPWAEGSGPAPIVLEPAETHPPTHAEMVAARIELFGAGNVDPDTGTVRADRVIFSWASVATFAAAVKGHVILFDAYVNRYLKGNVPVAPQDLAAILPEYVILGHGHFDHAEDAAPIVAASGATLVGDAGQCAFVQAQMLEGQTLQCREVMPSDAELGTSIDIALLPGVQTTVVKQPHSPSPANPPDFLADTPDDGTSYSPCPLESATKDFLFHLPSATTIVDAVARSIVDPANGVYAYRFQVDGFSFLWMDSASALRAASPAVGAALRALPPVDVQFGALSTFARYQTCMRDIRLYTQAVRPRMFIPEHHDPIDPNGPRTGAFKEVLEQEFANIPPDQRPCVRWIDAPADYVAPEALTFSLGGADPCLGSLVHTGSEDHSVASKAASVAGSWPARTSPLSGMRRLFGLLLTV